MLPNEAGTTECIDVLCASEHNAGCPNVLRLGGSSGPKFTFDQVFGAQTVQSEVYEDRVAPLVANCLEGYNATVLAYGQTGSGKTHTIMGGGMTTAMMQEQHQGVLPRAIRNIFQKLQEQQESSSVGSSYEYELYGEEIRDLLNPRTSSSAPKLSIRDIGNGEPEVIGATMHKVDSADQALLCLTSGMCRRVTGSTAMNETSSRSHAILSLVVEQSIILEHVQSKVSRFNFVDLAGSERQKRTQATGQRLKEGIDINKGLLVLGNVISALGDPKKQGTFVPYRDSKLTRLLKGSLGGNHKTLMIACVSPSSCNMEETLNCLRYANRAKNIQNHAVVNVDATSQIV
ncbi:kinesin-domain-containing protein, partial [Fragilariopsis cylindrus CCMP1102]